MSDDSADDAAPILLPVTIPEGLTDAGAELYREIAQKWRLRPDERRILFEACCEADLIDGLAAAMKWADHTVEGSQGQLVVNPLISELRAHRMAFASLMKQLKLPDDAPAADTGGETAPRSMHARAAAAARWGKRV